MKARISWWLPGSAVAAGTLALVLVANPGRAQQEPSVPARTMQDITTMSLYTGDTRLGTFPGKLVCLRCDMTQAAGGTERCKKEGHRHALSMRDGDMVHPLLAGTEEAQDKINSNELHGKEVKVSGKYYPSTGFILVTEIVPAG